MSTETGLIKAENGLRIIENKEFGNVRIVDRGGEPWFIARDVAAALGYAVPHKAVLDHCNYVESLSCSESEHLTGQSNPVKIIPEADVYALIFRSNLPTAEKFRDWVFREVLPAIRKTGKYAVREALALKDKVDLAKSILDSANIGKPLKAVLLNEFVHSLCGEDFLAAMQISFDSYYGEPSLNTCDIAREFSGYSASGIDYQLKKLGLQIEDDLGDFWMLTERGARYGKVVYDRKPRGFYPVSNIKWAPIVIDLLRLYLGLPPACGNEEFGVNNILNPVKEKNNVSLC